MRTSSWLLSCLALGAVVLSNAEDVVEDIVDDLLVEDDDYDDDVDSHDITVRHFFPENNEKKLPLGQEVTVLVDFANNGQDDFNVTRIGAFLHSPFDLDYYIQNFTQKEVAGLALGGSQVSLEYTFTPDEKLEPLEYWISGFVEYTTTGSDEPYRFTFVNGTTDLVDTSAFVDVTTVFSYVCMMGVLALGAYFAVNAAAEKAGVQKPKKKKYVAPTEAETAAADDSWDVTAYTQQAKSRTARRGKNSKK